MSLLTKTHVFYTLFNENFYLLKYAVLNSNIMPLVRIGVEVQDKNCPKIWIKIINMGSEIGAVVIASTQALY